MLKESSERRAHKWVLREATAALDPVHFFDDLLRTRSLNRRFFADVGSVLRQFCKKPGSLSQELSIVQGCLPLPFFLRTHSALSIFRQFWNVGQLCAPPLLLKIEVCRGVEVKVHGKHSIDVDLWNIRKVNV